MEMCFSFYGENSHMQMSPELKVNQLLQMINLKIMEYT